MGEEFKLRLRGKTCVFVDWANVHGWERVLERSIEIKRVKSYLSSLGIKQIRFYFGTDSNKKSVGFISRAKKLGFKVVTKPVKYLRIRTGNGYIRKRKCDFDLEIGLDCYERLERYDSFVFWSGDGDYATLYQRLLKKRKQVIVIFGRGCLGIEVSRMRGVYLCSVEKIFPKNIPGLRRGLD